MMRLTRTVCTESMGCDWCLSQVVNLRGHDDMQRTIAVYYCACLVMVV